MKKVLTILSASFILCSNQQLKAQHSLQEIWQTDSVFQFSEGVVPSEDGKLLYVSNTIGNPIEKDGQGSISTVGLDGKVINLNWVTGMNAPKDIQRYKNLIYAADLDEVVVIDADKAAIVTHIKIEGAQLLHNIAIDKKGIVYVSDLFAGKIYKIE
ncbi:MAG: ATP/GTP-binding protein, partial [Bacteroidetes bacterium]|nr:ATP/GTP-binding protein [Bacteroidota bacterium]